jgi:hypothetical protein
MSHIRWVPRQNKLEIPKDKDEVNKRDIHECNGRTHDPDTMVPTLTPDTQDETKNRSPHQGTADHCLKSRRRRCAEEVSEATVSLRELHS